MFPVPHMTSLHAQGNSIQTASEMPNSNRPRHTSYKAWVSKLFAARGHILYCGLVREPNVEEYQ